MREAVVRSTRAGASVYLHLWPGKAGFCGVRPIQAGFLRLPERDGTYRRRCHSTAQHSVRYCASRLDCAAGAGVSRALWPHRSQSFALPALHGGFSERLAASAELGVHKLRYVNLPGFFGWWTNARLLRRESQSAAQITAFDRYIVPVASRIEAVVPPPFGQSLLAVLRGR